MHPGGMIPCRDLRIVHCRGGSIRDAPLRIEGRTVGDAGPYKEIPYCST